MTRWLLVATLAFGSASLDAGTACEKIQVDATAVAAAAATALRVHHALDSSAAPVALLARVGTDLSGYGLVYSHAGFAVRDPQSGRWSVLHLLNRCGSDRSSLYREGLVNFFADNLVNQDARIVWLESALAQRLAELLASQQIHALHHPTYSVIARPDSHSHQNSTAWVLELLLAAQLPGEATRRRAQALATAQGFAPDYVSIPYRRRVVGGLFAANASFTDHPLATRLSGRYPVVSVRAILRYLDAQQLVDTEREWRGGHEMAAPGPA